MRASSARSAALSWPKTRSATEVVDALESRGLVQRRPDPSDRRATLAELTGHGGEVLAAVRAAARGTEAQRVFGQLSSADRAELARILGLLRVLAEPTSTAVSGEPHA